jgi:hypothetical protein
VRVTAPAAGRRWAIALLVTVSVGLGLTAVLGQELLPVGPRSRAEPVRPLSAEEATRLARMRQLNWQDARAGVRATIGDGAEQVHVAGWVDWQHPAVYLARSGPTPGVVAELVQAVPGLVAARPVEPEPDPPTPGPSTQPPIVDPYPLPPADPPRAGWRLRAPGADGPAGEPADPGTVDALATLLLTIAAEDADVAELLADSEARWLRRDRTAGYEVDVLLGPAIPPSPPPPGPLAPGRAADTSLAAMGGAVQYWLDDQARLRRLEALLATDTPVRVDLDRDDHTPTSVLAVLGGDRVTPRPVTGEEADRLAQLRQRNRAAAGGEVAMALPTEDGGTVTAAGWLDWQRMTAYLAVAGSPDAGLLWADGTGVATRSRDEGGEALPPLPVPRDDHWQRSPWEGRGDDRGGYDLDLLLNEVLSLSDWNADDPTQLRETAVWLRADSVDGTPVSVYEIPRSIESESEVAPGEARLRYWVDDESGVLRRLEIRTRAGGFGWLDLVPGPVPPLG